MLNGRRDRNRVYFFEKLVTAIDAQTFEIVFEGVMKDRNHVYVECYDWSCKPLPGADAATFESLGYFYFKDRFRVYRLRDTCGRLVDDLTIELSSIKAVGPWQLEDAQHVYTLHCPSATSEGGFITVHDKTINGVLNE